METTELARDLGQVEERMRSVVDHVLEGIITIDADAVIRTFNPAAERIFGYAATEVIGRNVKLLMPEPYRSEHDRYVADYLRTRVARVIGVGREVVGRRKDASTFPMALGVSEFQIGGRRFFTGIVRDISERAPLEQELRRRLDELAEADRQKNEFLAMLGHELRNPLAPLRNALFLLQSGPCDAASRRAALAMMDRQLDQLVRLVDDLLDVSRIVRGEVELRTETMDAAEAVLRAVETTRPLVDAQGHSLDLELPAETLAVEGDVDRLAQVVANLLTNAAKYTDRGGRIRVSLCREEDEAVIRVCDSGIGIEPELLPRVFDAFVQGRRGLARSQGGLGIGLSIVRRLVEMHGGSVAAASDGPGSGSEFEVRLPLARGHRAPDVAPEPARSGCSSPRRVLVVDDNVDAAESTALLLSRSGHDVRCVYDGACVLGAAAEFRPQVVVLDIGLPGLTGHEVARQIRARPDLAGTLLVALTGYGQAADHDRALAAGFDHHLTKPADLGELERLIARAPRDAPG